MGLQVSGVPLLRISILDTGHQARAEARLSRGGCLVAVVAHEGGPDVGLTTAQHQSPKEGHHKMRTSDAHL